VSDLVFYLCPHDLDKRRERCLMCEDAKGHYFTMDSLAAALHAHIIAEAARPPGALGPNHRCRSDCAAAIIRAAKEAERE
jgi:hypothetical protein